MAKFDYDCSGWATKAKTKCYDGLTIAPNAFQECDGKVVTMVYNHDHDNLENVLGHCLLENRPGGMYCYAKFNDTDTGRTAKACVENGDLNAFSIYANCIKKTGNTVQHGIIQEVSLVLAGCNPGALIDEVVKHSADEDYEGGEAFIYTDGGLSIAHGLDPDGEPLDDLVHSGDAATDEATQEEAEMADEQKDGKTLKEVYNSMTPEQQECCHALVGLALEERDGEETDDEEEETVKQNVFEKDTKGTVLKHSIDEINKVVKTAKTCGTMKAAFANAGIEDSEVNALCHGIDNIDWLFPEDHLLDTTPRIIDKPDDWVSVVMGGVKHIPFSRFKSLFADLTEDDARAKGYLKGNYKTEEVFGLLRRSTGPTTVYKKQELDRDDVVDITSFDVVAWLRNEMRYKLNRELALAYILGDGRMAASRDKIDENCIRPVFNDADLFTIKVQVKTTGLSTVEDKYKAFIKQAIRARKDYRGSGTPTMFTTEDALTEMLLLEDGMGHPLYTDEAALARKLRVAKIVTIPEMEGRKGAKGGDLAAVIVNLADYTVGADKGGAVNMFDDFDIDFNAQKYLIETRCSGALTSPYSAIDVTCASELGYLQERQCQVKNQFYTVEELVKLALAVEDDPAEHSGFKAEGKVFLPGSITVEKPESDTDKETASVGDCWDVLTNNVVEKYGGYLRLHKKIKMVDGVRVYTRYLDCVAKLNDKTDQVIRLGDNLLDISYYLKDNNIVNSVKAIGWASWKEGFLFWETTHTVQLTAEAYNGDSIKKYGLCQKIITVEGTSSTLDSLYEKAKDELKKYGGSGFSGSLQINTADLADIGVDTDRLGFLKETYVLSEPHGIENWLPCVKEVIPLHELDEKDFTFGETTSKLSSLQAANLGTAGKAWNAIQSTIGYLNTK